MRVSALGRAGGRAGPSVGCGKEHMDFTVEKSRK